MEIDVRADLLTPFGNMHGGVMAALCDHVLGTVCYPVGEGSWAATTEFKLNDLVLGHRGQRARRGADRVAHEAHRRSRASVRNGDRVACLAQGTVLGDALRSRPDPVRGSLSAPLGPAANRPALEIAALLAPMGRRSDRAPEQLRAWTRQPSSTTATPPRCSSPPWWTRSPTSSLPRWWWWAASSGIGTGRIVLR